MTETNIDSTHTREKSNKPSTYDIFIGNYDYATLCMPRFPCFPRMRNARSVFFGLKDRISVLVALIMGLQHALVMAVGVVAVPRILVGSGFNHLQLEPEVQSHLISISLIICSLASIIQIVRVRLFRGYWLGTGLISISGTSFTFLPVAEAAIAAMRDSGVCPREGGCPDAYGLWLGTVAVGSLAEIALSFVPHRVLNKAFPPVVTGTTVFLIGMSLIGGGLRGWAGGSGGCYSYAKLVQLGGLDAVPDRLSPFADCPSVAGPGDRHYPWGDAHWIGLAFFVFAVILMIEFFGSPFMRNTQVVLALFAGIILSLSLGYTNTTFITQAPVITIPFRHTFKLGVYWPALLPVLIGYLISAVDAVGDISASAEASRVATTGPEFESRIQGGILADGLNSLFAALCTVSPTGTYSVNNGIIVMTMTANKYAGLAACAWLFLFGVFGKVGGVIASTPAPVINGILLFLFASITASGINILSTLSFNRRDRFILSTAIGLGVGLIIEPKVFSQLIPTTQNEFLDALRQAALIVLESGFSLGAIIAIILNVMLPKEGQEVSVAEFKNEVRGDTESDESVREQSNSKCDLSDQV